MGKFDGILICSDIDGTFEEGRDFEKYTPNVEAVKYFTENGGRFTFTTGRYLSYLKKPRFASIINAPASSFNGTVVYDYQNEKLLYQHRLYFSNAEIIELLTPFKDTMRLLNCCHNIDAALSQHYGFDQPAECLSEHSMKIVCATHTEDDALIIKRYLEAQPLLKDCYVNRAWDTGIEIIPNNSTKGQALDFIKAHLGDIHTSIGIGDYENDLPMIQHADIGIAVGNAVDALKDAADYVLCDYRAFAIKELIEKLDSGEIKK